MLRKMKNKILSLVLAILFLSSLASALNIDSVSVKPEEIKQGEKISLELVIENNLDSDVEDVSISLDLKDIPFAPYLTSNQVSYEGIKEGKEKEARFNLIAFSDAESGTYKIPVKISYILDLKEIEKEGVVSLIINAKPELEVFAEDAILIKGQSSELIIRIVNSGLGDVKLLSLELETVRGMRILDNKKVYIGDIDSDDFDSVEFKLKVDENAPSIISLPIKLNYKDFQNNNIEENKNLELRIYTKEQAINLGLVKKSNTLVIVIGIIILIILFLVYRAIRKKLKKKRLGQEV